MAYDYYCMECGKQLNQETVLFDMQYILTRDIEKKFQLLKFRMTKEELLNLIASGTPGAAGYYHCTITFQQIMQIIANSNNLNAGKVYTKKDENGNDQILASDADIAYLTLAEIDAYINAANATFASQKNKNEFDPFADIDDTEEEEEKPVEEYKPSAAVFALEAKDETNTDKAYTKVILRSDFEILRGVFIQNNTFSFIIKAENDTDNEGQPVLVGYNVAFAGGSGHMTVEARVCPSCGYKVFLHAGTAKHQAVAFIGYQSAGKTSTILALAHYAQNHMMFDLADVGDEATEIWRGANTIKSVASVELLDKNARLMADLDNYSLGLAPGKTEASKRNDAYCATLRIKNKLDKKYYLFTLTDLPGELCNEDGTVKKDRIYNSFPVALSCDAFVACFDTANINPSGGGGVANWIMNVCRWADEFQKMRASQNQVSTYVPTMLLFTKCKDLEDPNTPPLPKATLFPIDQTYLLKDEKRRIKNNNLYTFVCDQFNEFGQLHRAYHAMMRCSPYGYKAPSRQDLQGEKRDQFQQQRPVPKNIDILMRWLLSVAGCVPTEGSYRTNPFSPDCYELKEYCICRPQLRSENPIKDHELDESMARCILFENPGKFDAEYVAKYDSKAKTVVVKLLAQMHPDGNADIKE